MASLMSRTLMTQSHFTKTIYMLKRVNKYNRFLLPAVTNTFERNIFLSSENGKNNNNNNNKKDLSSLFKPVPVTPDTDPDGIDIGTELVGELDKSALVKVLGDFYRRKEVKMLAAENGLDNTLFHQVHVSFRRFCIESKNLPTELHIVLSDILRGAGHVDDLFPYFLGHAKYMFPHLDCKEDLQKISDLRLPANWYPEARAIRRKIIYHAGPTNSGKTYHALHSFSNAESGVYCGPLRMLANEVFHKTNEGGTPCDLVTGEERKYVLEDENPAEHVSCTVEMTSVTTPYEVAVIDEIQMIRDQNRGWAWTRALLGLCAKEVHICGEASAIDFISELVLDTGDELEIRHYKRLTKLKVLSKAIDNFDNVVAGDCVVCFNKNDIYHVSRQLEKRSKEVAVIYGTLPPGAKLHQANRFNDPDDPCKIMVATDAIGMGLNLNINRIIFYSLIKPTINEKGEKEIDVIPPSTALQIAGRAGRYGTEYEEGGKVTTYRNNDLPLLKKLLNTDVDPVEQAGLHPTADQIELFSYHLPKATLSNIIDIFVTLCQLDNDKYFLCNVDDFKFLADMIEHIPLSLRSRYVFCCAPIPKKQAFVCTMFLKFSRQFSREQPLTLDWLCKNIDWPFKPPSLIVDLAHLEGVFDVLDLYLWLSYRFPDMFPDTTHVRDMQTELDHIIRSGVSNITQLLKNSESGVSSAITDDEDDFEMNTRKTNLRTLKRLQKQRDTDSYKVDLTAEDTSFAKRFRQALQKRPDTAFDSRIGIEDESGSVKQTLTEKLLKQGILTEEMLEKLKLELASKKDKK